MSSAMEKGQIASNEELEQSQQMAMDLDLAMKMLDEVQGLLEQMYELAERAASDECTDEERHALQGKLIILRERIDETVDAYDRMGSCREALYSAWKAAALLASSIRS